MAPRHTPGRVVLVGGGPGDPDLLTVRALRHLRSADVVVADRLGPTSVLDDLPLRVEIIDVGKAPGQHAMSQERIDELIVERARRGQVVVRLKGGDPFVLGRGGEEVLACRDAGVEVEVVPGISSALAVPALAGVPSTHRGVVGAVHVTHGHEPLTATATSAVVTGEATLVVLMGVARLAEPAASLLAAGAAPSTPVAVVESGSTPDERVTRAPLSQVAAVAAQIGVSSPAVVVVGAVAAEGFLDARALVEAVA
ncbi:uroporphyrinogen-III C-methyltransferase [Janibacter melonis]|uniref:uroporphyrinogen-III C-methyltransferase n=1 Tax=Janibacter melonis TaxID=262209 RepID=UPI002095018D|nr:uroporphyrinogen-III C-methyltransferase [Janibacter melonis]